MADSTPPEYPAEPRCPPGPTAPPGRQSAYASGHAQQANLQYGIQFVFQEGTHLASQDVPAPPVATNLPHPTRRFVGRAEDVQKLLDRVKASRSSDSAMQVHMIDGMAGVGKTELALYVGHLVGHHFPDGAVFLDLAGYSPDQEPTSPSEALRLLLAQRNVATDSTREIAGLRALWRRECAHNQLLILLDNAADQEQVAPLLPDTPGCVVLVTSRRKLIGLRGGTPLPLDPLAQEDAEQLLLDQASIPEAVDAKAAQRVVYLCGRLPLAVGIAASMLAHRPGYTMTELADDLEAERRYPDDLADDDGSMHIAVHASIRLSYRNLPEPLMAAFRMCGWHPGPDITEPALAVMLAECEGDPRCRVQLTDRAVASAHRLLLGLADRNLIRRNTSSDWPRFRMHDLVRASARRSHTEKSEWECREAINHLASACYATLQHAEAWRYGGPGVARLQLRDTPLRTFTNLADAVTWVLLERENLLALIDALEEQSADISRLLAPQLRDRGFLADAQHCYQDAESGYARMGRAIPHAHALRGLAHIAISMGEFPTARRYYNRARAISRRKRDDIGQALALRGLGDVARMVDDYDKAAEYLSRAASILATHTRERRDPMVAREYAIAIAILADVEWSRGDLDAACTHLSQAYDVHTAIGDSCAKHRVVTSLAEIKHQRGDLVSAYAEINAALREIRAISDPPCEANALWELGQLQKDMAEPDKAITTFKRVLELRKESGTPFGCARALLGLADAERLAGHLDRARSHFEEALHRCRDFDDCDGIAQAHIGIGDIAVATYDRTQAARSWRQALDIATEIDLAPIIQKAQNRLSTLNG